jgi:hypothetical protein
MAKSRAKAFNPRVVGHKMNQRLRDFQKKPEKRVEFRSHAIAPAGRVGEEIPRKL